MSDDHRKKKKRKGKNKKKGNNSLPKGAASVESLQFKVDIAPSEQVHNDEEGGQILEPVPLDTGLTDIQEKESHNITGERSSGKEHDELKENEKEINSDSRMHFDVHSEEGELQKDVSCSTKQVPDESYNVVGDDSDVLDESPGVIDKKDCFNLAVAGGIQDIPESSKVDIAVASTVEDFFNRSPEENNSNHDADVEQGLKPLVEKEVVIDVQSSPWKVDKDVREIVEHNTRTRMTKVVRTRKVIVTKTEDGDEIKTVIEEEDDDNPEVIGEIGMFDESEQETVEVQRVVKKRRVIVGKACDNVQYTEYSGEAGSDVPFEEASTITRKVMFSKNEFDEDVETIIDEITINENEVKFDTVVASALDDNEHDNDDNDDYDIQSNGIATRLVKGAKYPLSKSEAEENNYKGHDEAVIPVEVVTVERDASLEDLLGPANEEHEAILEQQQKDLDFLHKDKSIDDYHFSEDFIVEKNAASKTETKEIVSEDVSELLLDPKRSDICDLSKLEMRESEKPLTSKATYNSKIQVNLKLTEEQRHLLDEVSIPDNGSALEDWILVNFTSKEIVRFAELMRLKPGWREDSGEMTHCCPVM